MSTRHIKSHSFDAHRKAARAITTTISKMDADIRALQRRQDLFPAEQDRRITESRQAGEAAIRQHRQALAAAIAEDRREATYADEAPTADEATRRTYYSQQAVAELAGLTNPADVLARVQQVAASGDHERAREYVRAAAGRTNPGALGAVQRQVEPPEARMHRSFAAAVDTMEYQLGWFDQFVATHVERAGFISKEAKEGTAVEESINLRQLNLWIEALPQRTGDAFSAHEQREANEAGIVLDGAGSEGWDTSGDTGADA